MDPRPAESGTGRERSLEQKARRRRQFHHHSATIRCERAWTISHAFDGIIRHVPVLCGILPLVSPRHARFLHEKVPEISVPTHLLEEIESAGERAPETGIANARTMLAEARLPIRRRLHYATVQSVSSGIGHSRMNRLSG